MDDQSISAFVSSSVKPSSHLPARGTKLWPGDKRRPLARTPIWGVTPGAMQSTMCAAKCKDPASRWPQFLILNKLVGTGYFSHFCKLEWIKLPPSTWDNMQLSGAGIESFWVWEVLDHDKFTPQNKGHLMRPFVRQLKLSWWHPDFTVSFFYIQADGLTFMGSEFHL